MPYIIDPKAPAPSLPEQTTSLDNKLRATLDKVNAGALLRANFQTSPGAPGVSPTWPANLYGVRFYRADGTPVRSGAPRPAPGGIAYAYDREAPLGAAASWYAVPVYNDGSTGAASGQATLNMPAPPLSGLPGVWLKSIGDPSLAALVTATAVPELSFEGRQNFSPIVGSSYPSVSFDAWGASTGSWSFWAPTRAIKDAILRVLTSGVVLVQANPASGVPDAFVLFGNVTVTRAGSVVSPGWTLNSDFTEVERPPVEGSPLFIPGHSWADFLAKSVTWPAPMFGSWGGALAV